MRNLYGFNVLTNERNAIPACTGELQQQDLHCQQPRAACQKLWRIDVPASCALVRSRNACGMSVVNKSKKKLENNGRFKDYGWLHPAMFYCSKGSGPTGVQGTQGFILGCIFIFNRANGKPPRPIGANDGHLLIGNGRFHWQGLLPMGHEQGLVENQSGNWLRQIVSQSFPHYKEWFLQ